jgi:hypothetical protein
MLHLSYFRLRKTIKTARHMKKTLFFLWMLPAMLGAQGMWMPLHLEKQNEKEMKAMGLKLDADDL